MVGAIAELAQPMCDSVEIENALKLRVDQENLERRNTIWNCLNENQHFAILDIDYLEDLALTVFIK